MKIRKEALLTLIGVMMIKISTGVLSLWGSLNLYILSYFNYHGTKIIPLTNSLIILAIIIPTSIIILWATKISNRFGYVRIARICALIFCISPQLINLQFSLPVFCLTCVFIPASMFAISSIPIINCLWTQFPEVKHKATSLAVFCYGFGSIIWNYFFTMQVNPNNIEATIINEDGMMFFGEQVVDKVFATVRNGYLVCGSLFVLGSMLIKKNEQYQEVQFEEFPQSAFVQRQSYQESGALSLPPASELVDTVRASLRHSKNQQNSNKQNQQGIEQNLIKNLQANNLNKVLFSRKFIYIFLISLFSGIYQIYIQLNIKLLYMPIINNDHFLVMCAIVSYTVAIFGALFWGYVGDKKGIYISLLIYTTADLLIKFYGCFAGSKVSIFVMFIMLGLSDKGMMTMMGPGLVEMFGIKLATELLPYKGISIFAGYVMVPLLYILLSTVLTSLQFLFFLLLFSIICVFLAYKLFYL